MPRLGSCRAISTNGSEVTTRTGRIKAAGVAASRRCKHSLTPSPLRGKKRSLPDHHQQRTGHLQKGTVCKIKYKLLQRTRAALGPDPGPRALLANAGFILKPDFDRPAGKLLRDCGARQPGEVFLKASCASRSLCGCTGRPDMLLKFSFFSSLPTLRSCR